MIKIAHLISWQGLLLTASFAGCFLLPGGGPGHTLTDHHRHAQLRKQHTMSAPTAVTPVTEAKHIPGQLFSMLTRLLPQAIRCF